MSNPDFSELARALRNPASLVTNLSGWEEYFHDATEESTTPAFIVLAECAADVIAAVSFAEKHRIPLTPRGAGTGLSGGCVPPKNGLVLSTERMKKLTIDPEKRIAVCGPGVITKELLDASAPHGLTYPPDPASYNECSLGGNVAENAGGLRCKRYGVTRDYVIGIKAVTARGSTLETGIYNDNRGFSIEDILIGSEGTLAVITELTVRLIETPSAGNTILIAFDDSRNAARAVSEITAAGIIPTVMEYLDGDAADCSNRYEKYDGLDRVAAILLIETAGDRKTEQTTSVRNLCERNHCSYLRIAENPETAATLWSVRRNLSKAIRDIARFRYNEDVSVPISKFMTLIDFVDQLNQSGPLRVNAFGHAGDGNLHVSFLSMSGTIEEKKLIREGTERLYRKTVELGGTLTGEHGIGQHKGKYLHWEFDRPTLELMKKTKDVFDPENLLNPNKIFQH